MTDFELARISYVALGNTPSEWTVIPEQTFSKIASVFGPTKIDRLGDKIVSIRGDFPKHVEQRLTCEVPAAHIFSELPGALDEHEGAAGTGAGAGGWVADVHSLSEDDNLIDGQMILVCVEAKDKSKEMYDFVEDFMFRTHQTDEAEEFILSGRCRSSNTIYAFYGAKVNTGIVDRRQANLKILYRLKDRKRLALASGKHEDVKAKIGQNHNIVRASVLKDRDAFFTRVSRCRIYKSQGIDLIRLQVKTSTFDVQMYEQQVERSISTRRTAEEVDADVRAKIDDFVERINRYMPIEKQVRTNLKLDEDTIADLVISRVFLTSDRAFLRANRRLFQDLIDQQIRLFKESEPAEAKAKRLKTVQDGRRALAESYAQKIKEYCDERVDEHGFCKLKNAYTHHILAKLVGDELITDDEYDEARTVKDKIDEVLMDARTENNECNKGDLTNAKELGRRLLEIFVLEFERFDSIELSDFYSDPREYVRRRVFENGDVAFGPTQFALFNGIHHDLIMSTVRTEYVKVQRARQAFVDAEQLRRSEEVEDTERAPFEELQRVRRSENDEITEFVKRFEAFRTNMSRVFRVFAGSYKEKYEQYKRSPNGFTPEQIAVFEEDDQLAPIQGRLFKRHNVRTVDELKTKYHKIRDYVRDLRPFTPLEHEVREYIRTNFTTICDN